MAVIRKSDAALKCALRSPHLAGRACLGRGMFSMVFEARPQTVYKLTTDRVHYDMLRQLRGRHFPRLVSDIGKVASRTELGMELAFYLVEVERLQALTAGTDASRLAKRLVAASGTSRSKYIFSDVPDQALNEQTLLDVANQPALPDSVRFALTELAAFALDQDDAGLDFHYRNFMARDNGDLVFSDPLTDQGVFRVFNR